MSKENLISLTDRSIEEATEIRRKGGIARQKQRKEQKTLAESLKILLEMQNPQTGNSFQDDITIALATKASKGSEKAYELIRDTIGQKPVEKTEITSGQINITVDDKTEE